MKVAVSWSGGKESNLACFKAMESHYEVSLLVTFLWETSPLLHHPLELMELQSKALAVPYIKMLVKPPHFEGYKKVLLNLVEKYGIEGVVTGDVYVTDEYHGDWMKKVCDEVNLKLIRPLWAAPPRNILSELVSRGFKAMFTSVKNTWFSEDWLGRVLDDACISELMELEKKFGIDPCGERGEYHTMVIDAPMFKEAIEILEFKKEMLGSSYILKPVRFSLKPKAMHRPI
ncbi:MAG: diphthine--ammonia ligase [Candidatus Bathyarchaeia archaeon]